MTREEFIDSYCRRSKIPWQWLSMTQKAVPCDCGERGCSGYQMKSLTNFEKELREIDVKLDFDNPKLKGKW